MVARTLAPVAMALLVFSACKGSGETEKKVPDAAPLQSSQSLSPAPASASASPGAGAQPSANAPPFTGKLTPAMIASFESSPKLFQMKSDEAVAEVSRKLGKPTGQDKRRVVWGVSDGATCRSYSIQIDGTTVTGADKSSEVKAAAFGEQWGKSCLLAAGLSPVRRPYTGKTLSVAELRASKSNAEPIRIRGVLSEPEPAGATGASFLLTDAASTTARERCTLEMGALSPTEWNGKTVTVECASQACNHCFFVK